MFDISIRFKSVLPALRMVASNLFHRNFGKQLFRGALQLKKGQDRWQGRTGARQENVPKQEGQTLHNRKPSSEHFPCYHCLRCTQQMLLLRYNQDLFMCFFQDWYLLHQNRVMVKSRGSKWETRTCLEKHLLRLHSTFALTFSPSSL